MRNSRLVFILLSVWLAGCAHQRTAVDTGITPEDLLAATLQPADVNTLLPEPQRWWPGFPRLNIRPPIGGPGCEAYAGLAYQKINDPAKNQINVGLGLYCDAASAAAGMFALTNTLEKGATACAGPAVGEQSRYFTRVTSEKLCETALRFRVGRVVGRVAAQAQDRYEDPEKLARYAQPLVEKTRAVLDGKLHAAPFPKDVAQRMPSKSVCARVGPLLGSALIPSETLALVDLSGQPLEVRDRLQRLGITQLGFRRYGVENLPGHVIEATLFTFPDARAAAAWAENFRKQAGEQGALKPGRLGAAAAYMRNADGSFYLKFARERHVADLLCYAPFAKTEPAAEALVRQFAERWYAELPDR